MGVALGRSGRRAEGGARDPRGRSGSLPRSQRAHPGPPGPSLVLISISSNVPRNSISYEITSRVPREPEALFTTARLSGDRAAVPLGFPSLGCWPTV